MKNNETTFRMRVKLKHFVIMLWFLLAAGGTFAQDSLSFSLAKARDYALKNSYVIRNSDLDVASARKKVWETIATGLPQVSGSASYSNYLNLPVSLIPGEFFGGEAGTYVPVKFGQDYNSDFGFTVDQLIFDGSYIVGISSAKIYLQLSAQTKEKTEIEIRHAVEQAYYSVLLAEENLSVMKENLINSQKLENDTKAMYENGFVEEQDQDQMRLIVQKAENEVLKAEREIRISKMVLKYTMGLDMGSEIILLDKLSDFVDPLVAEQEVVPKFDYTSHIDYRLLDTQRQASQKLLKLEKSAYLPQVKAFYNWSKTAYGENANLFDNDVSWYKSALWGINVTVPVFSAGQRISRVKQAGFDYEKAANDQSQAIQSLQKDYITAVADMESAVDQLRNDVDNKMLARKIYEKTVIKYNNGITGSTELSQTETQYIQSQGEWVSSVMQLLTSKINLDKATGK